MSNSTKSRPHERRRLLNNIRYQLAFAALLLLAQVIGAASFQSLFQWRVARILPQHDPVAYQELLYGILDESLFSMVFVSATLGALMFLLGLWYSNRVVGPIPRITRAIRSLNGGRYGIQLVLRRGDVLTGLVNELNALSATLKRRHQAESGSTADAEASEEPEIIQL